MPDNFQILRRSNNIYTALYRKLRPTSFADVVGQEHIIRTLTNQIELGRLSHAYLFCGTRGTGKTTCARVFARAVNCEASVGGEACGVCRPCVDIAAGTSLDVIEIDAASNNGVDNIRDLREEVRYPATGRYKVYIVDEVHMLSAGAFNALLKTLEEPPPHVIFILATTDPQKIPATIHSRLMRFDFHRASQEQMTEALGRFMEGESIAVTSDALAYVARLSDGSWRDALSILDRCAALYYGEEITLAGVLEVTGSVDDGVFFALIESLMGRDAQKCLEIIEEMSAKGRDFGQFVEELLHHLRNMLMEAAKAKDDNYHDIIGLIGIFSELSRGMRHAGGHGRLMLEVACIEHAAGPRVVEVMAVAEPQMAKTHPKQQAKPPEEKPEEPKPIKKAIPADIQKALADWGNFIKDFEPNFAPFIAKTKAGYLEDEFLYIICPDLFTESHLRNRTEFIQDKLRGRYGVDFSINVLAKNFYDDRHRRKYNIEDDFAYASDMDKLRGMIDYDIEEV